jgi:thioredoxin 1
MRRLSLAGLAAILALGCGDNDSGKTTGKGTPPAPAEVIVLTSTNFQAEVLDSRQPVLVDFWAEWCMPCREMKPVMKELANDFAGRAKICQLNVDDHPRIASEYKIKGIPAFLIFHRGKLVERIIGGGKSKTVFAGKLNPLVGR